jgi:hypothetical protein
LRLPLQSQSPLLLKLPLPLQSQSPLLLNLPLRLQLGPVERAVPSVRGGVKGAASF